MKSERRSFPHPGQAKFAKKRSSNALDTEKLLHFSRQLYAHALTLQEVIRNEGEVAYEVLRPRYDRQAAQQFEIFDHTFNGPSGKPASAPINARTPDFPAVSRQPNACSEKPGCADLHRAKSRR